MAEAGLINAIASRLRAIANSVKPKPEVRGDDYPIGLGPRLPAARPTDGSDPGTDLGPEADRPPPINGLNPDADPGPYADQPPSV